MAIILIMTRTKAKAVSDFYLHANTDADTSHKTAAAPGMVWQAVVKTKNPITRLWCHLRSLPVPWVNPGFATWIYRENAEAEARLLGYADSDFIVTQIAGKKIECFDWQKAIHGVIQCR